MTRYVQIRDGRSWAGPGGRSFWALISLAALLQSAEVARVALGAPGPGTGLVPSVLMEGVVLLAAAAVVARGLAGRRRNRPLSFRSEPEHHLHLIDSIRDAISDDRLILYSQPIVCLRTGRVVREELLVRMIDGRGELVLPDAFLPIAERFGLMRDIDRVVVSKAIELARDRPVAVNVSGESLGDPHLAEQLGEAVADGLDPGQLVVEITETAALTDIEYATRFADRLARIGCELALDDFGTGFSSLIHLKHLPARYLKIDREFTRALPTSRSDRHLVRAMVEIGHGLGQRVIAEGVERLETLTLLQRLRVDMAQGYLLGRPRPAERLDRVTPEQDLRDEILLGAGAARRTVPA